LNGKQWLQNSISVWGDVRKSTEETRLKHPAMFPTMLVERLIETFLPLEAQVVLDPFAGSGSTIVTAARLGKQGIGLELSPEYVELANQRLAEIPHQPIPLDTSQQTSVDESDQSKAMQQNESGSSSEDAKSSLTSPQESRSVIHQASARDLLQFVAADSVDLSISSPPYWNILNQRRTADMKKTRHYGNRKGDLGLIEDYEEFLDTLQSIYADVLTTLKPCAYCCIIVMDLRKKSQFFPLHSDLATRLQQSGFIFDDLIIWNRQSEYNNLRPLGYPSVFRINKVHEFILLMQKPAD
jgi:DNA modification methylase